MESNHHQKLWRAFYIVFILILKYRDADAAGGCHMLIGGSSSSSRFMPTVEIFDAEANAGKMHSVKLEYGVKSHSGGIINGKPVICGGIVNDTTYSMKCFEFDSSWKEVIPDLPIHSSSAGKAIVDEKNKKMYIFGGANFNTVPQIKILNYNETHKSWENGTSFYDDGFYYGHCSVLVNRTVYFFGLGGRGDGKIIGAFNLDKPELGVAKLNVTLQTNRHQSTCAEVNGSIYIVGGRSIGVEIFSLESQSSEVVSQDFPDDYMLYAQLMKFNDDLYLYGGVMTYETRKTVDKFSTSARNWTRDIASLQEERSSFVALNVDDSLCADITTTTTVTPTDATTLSTGNTGTSTDATTISTANTGSTDVTTAATTLSSTISPTAATTSGSLICDRDGVWRGCGTRNQDKDATDLKTCQKNCNSIGTCGYISYKTNYCYQFDGKGCKDVGPSPGFKSFEKNCFSSPSPAFNIINGDCHFDGQWSDCGTSILDAAATDYLMCHQHCQMTSTCEYFSFSHSKRLCYHFSNCNEKKSSQVWMSGKKGCSLI